MPLPPPRKAGLRAGRRNPVVGAIHELPLRVRRNKPAPCLTRRRMRGTPQMGVFQQPANTLTAETDSVILRGLIV